MLKLWNSQSVAPKIPVFSDKDMRLLESKGMPSFSQVVVVRGAQEMKHFSSAVLPSSTCFFWLIWNWSCLLELGLYCLGGPTRTREFLSMKQCLTKKFALIPFLLPACWMLANFQTFKASFSSGIRLMYLLITFLPLNEEINLFLRQSSIKCGVSSQRNLCHFFGS